MLVGSDLHSFARREKNCTRERFGRVGVVDALRANQQPALMRTNCGEAQRHRDAVTFRVELRTGL